MKYMIIKQNDEISMYYYNWRKLLTILQDGDVSNIWFASGKNLLMGLITLGRRFNPVHEQDVHITNELFTMNLETLTRQAIVQALKRTGYNQRQAAKLLGIPKGRLNYKIKKLGIEHHSWIANTPVEK